MPRISYEGRVTTANKQPSDEEKLLDLTVLLTRQSKNRLGRSLCVYHDQTETGFLPVQETFICHKHTSPAAFPVYPCKVLEENGLS